MTDPRKPIFDAIRMGRDNRGFKELEVREIDALLDKLGVARLGDDGEDYERLLSEAVKRPVDGTIKIISAALRKHAGAYGQNQSKQRLAEFIAQIACESSGFTRFEENLNYRAERLVQVWPNRFPTITIASAFAHNPQALANKVYGGRMGNVGTDDGWRFRGRGALQLTGRDNYEKYGDLIGVDLVANPDLAADPAISVLIALEYFKQAKVNEAIDRGDFRDARKRVNGGHHGLADVAAIRTRVLRAM